MSKEAIQKIREAEDQAAVLCRVAEEKANEMRERVREQGEAYLSQVERSTKEEYAAELAAIRDRATALETKKRSEAQSEARVLLATARERMDRAVKMIVWEIVEKCQ